MGNLTNKYMKFYFAALSLCISNSYAIPEIHPNLIEENDKYIQIKPISKYSLQKLIGNPQGTKTGIKFNFGNNLKGKLYYGFIKAGDGRYPQAVFYKKSAAIKNGIAKIKITKLSGKYDMIDWQSNAKGRLGYRVVNTKGQILYDGKIAFIGKSPFVVNNASIVEGPFINLTTDGNFYNSVRISFDTLMETSSSIIVNNQFYQKNNFPSKHHEITITGLKPDTEYSYTVKTQRDNQEYQESYSFKTAPAPGDRKAFVFAYVSDSRHATGGGERNIAGTNAYIVKKIMALASFKQARFLQFTGDLINGGKVGLQQFKLEYRNWKRTIEPFAHYLPVIAGVGNHELRSAVFKRGKKTIAIDNYPYATDSTEALFASQFVNPTNGPISEDGTYYDPNPNKQDFPSYKETVFYYIYDNVAMIVLNSNYWFSATIKNYPNSAGNLHGYLMDQQLAWLEKTVARLDKNDKLDHIFITFHTPIFPNGGHVKDDMWYHGNNTPRAVVKHSANGENLIKRGIIEQRDKLLTILMKSKKLLAVLTGDEHNFNWLRINKSMNIYPNNWNKADIRTKSYFRPLYQINNGAAGAPYYAQETTPWSKHVRNFTTQNAVVFFHVEGKSVQMEVLNPDTLDIIVPKQLLK